jgi:hypothetical protein
VRDARPGQIREDSKQVAVHTKIYLSVAETVSRSRGHSRKYSAFRLFCPGSALATPRAMKSLIFVSAVLLFVLPVMALTAPRAESTLDVPAHVESEQLTQQA